jgi:hypothetical protein
MNMVAPPHSQFASIKDAKPQGGAIYNTVHVTELTASLHVGSIVLLNDNGYEDDDDETSRPLMVAHSIDIAYSNDGILPDQVEKCKHSKAKVKVNILDQFDDGTYRSTSKVKPSLDTMRHVPELYQMTDFMTRHGSLLLCAILV